MEAKQKSTLRYRLAPDGKARQAIEETFVAYAAMFEALRDLSAERGGANLVTLHEIAYETVRQRTGLPARLVTLGLRDYAANQGRLPAVKRLPLDDKLFAIKGPSELTVSTVEGRVHIPYDVAGYTRDVPAIFGAELVAEENGYEIRIAVVRHSAQPEESMMLNEGLLSRMGRLIAGMANAAIDRAEGVNKVAVVEQALREIDSAAEEARTDIGKARAEEYRLRSRRDEINASLGEIEDKIRMAIASDREDLAKAGIARQIDLESQIAALDRALSDVQSGLDEGQQALQAVLATRREAEARLADLKKSMQKHPETTERSRGAASSNAARAAAAVARVTGVPNGDNASNAELDELDRLHREQAIEARLKQFKAGRH